MAEEGVVDVAAYSCGAEELGVVEDVEGLQAELQDFRFADVEISQQGQIGVEQSRARKESALHVSRCAQGVDRECRGVEIDEAVAARIGIDVERRAGLFKVVNRSQKIA